MNEMQLNEDHDIFFEGGSIRRFSKADRDSSRLSVQQSILCMLKTEQGEAFTNILHGVPWFGKILDLPVSHLDLATRILREKISAVEGVKDVVSIKLRVNGRKLGGSVKVRLEDGETVEGSF